MACRISELVLGCRDPEVLARFWCEVLDFVVLDREEDGSLEIGPREGFGGPQPTIILSRVSYGRRGVKTDRLYGVPFTHLAECLCACAAGGPGLREREWGAGGPSGTNGPVRMPFAA
jgi:hypothetical protein